MTARRLACVAIVLFAPLAAYAQADAVDLTASFVDGGVTIDMARELEGCHFQIESLHGVVRLRGQVAREVQKDVATNLAAKIDGVKAVHSELTLSAPPAGKQR